MMDADQKFAYRLHTACTLRKVDGKMARVALLMKSTACCRRTALRWLSGHTTPRHGQQIVVLASALDVDPAWLAGVVNDSPLLSALTSRFLGLAPVLQIEAIRLLDRLADTQDAHRD